MRKIKRVSMFFRFFFQFLLIALPLLLVMSWLYAPQELVWLWGVVKMNAVPSPYLSRILHPLSSAERIYGILVSSLPLSVYLFVLYALIKLFRLYEQGEIFSLNNVRYIRQVGYALLVSQALQPFYQFIMGVVLTMHNPKGQRVAIITLDQTNVGILLTGFMVILISWMMAEGCRLREEQQLTI